MRSATLDIRPPPVRKQRELDPAGVVRLALATRDLLDTARHIPFEEEAREPLRVAYQRIRAELWWCVTPDLYDELEHLVPGLRAGSIEEVRLALAGTLGWLLALLRSARPASTAGIGALRR